MIRKIRKLDSMPMKTNNKILSWQAPEFIQYQKNTQWYVILVTVGIALTILFYYVNNILAMIMVILAVAVLFITANQKPKNRICKLTKDGLKINDKFYPMADFKTYFITYVENTPDLHFEMTKRFSAPVSVFIEGIDEKEIVDFIRIYLPENTNVKATATDLFSKWFKF